VSAQQRKQYLQRWAALRGERDSWLSHWRELAENIRPRGYRYLSSDRNRGDKKNDAIINGTPIRGMRVLTAGMMSSVTSPSRRWFQLTTSDRALSELASVKEYLAQVADEISRAISKSNLYKALHHVYLDLVPFGTSCLLIEEDAEDGIRGYVFPLGSYCLANSSRMAVNTLYREATLTVGQLVEQFGLEACSLSVQNLHRDGRLDTAVKVMHVIEPNAAYSPGKLGPRGKAFSSCWFEVDSADEVGLLRESGYEEQPFIAPRWQTTADDVYGASCPGMEALGDCKALQESEREKAKAIDKVVTPPMQGPSSLAGELVSLLPGGFTAVDGTTPQHTLRPSVEVHPSAVATIGQEIRELENRIMALFYADLWLGITRADETMTATEVNARREEQLMQLGPVNENLQNEMLDPLIERVFAILQRQGRLPMPPEELQGAPIKVEYISVMAQAQKLVGVASIERLVAFVANAAALHPGLATVLDKVDFDQAADELASAFGTPPGVIRPDDVVEKIRSQRAAQQQQAQQMAAAQQAAETAQTLSATDTEGDNALTGLLKRTGVA